MIKRECENAAVKPSTSLCEAACARPGFAGMKSPSRTEDTETASPRLPHGRPDGLWAGGSWWMFFCSTCSSAAAGSDSDWRSSFFPEKTWASAHASVWEWIRGHGHPPLRTVTNKKLKNKSSAAANRASLVATCLYGHSMDRHFRADSQRNLKIEPDNRGHHARLAHHGVELRICAPQTPPILPPLLLQDANCPEMKRQVEWNNGTYYIIIGLNRRPQIRLRFVNYYYELYWKSL